MHVVDVDFDLDVAVVLGKWRRDGSCRRETAVAVRRQGRGPPDERFWSPPISRVTLARQSRAGLNTTDPRTGALPLGGSSLQRIPPRGNRCSTRHSTNLPYRRLVASVLWSGQQECAEWTRNAEPGKDREPQLAKLLEEVRSLRHALEQFEDRLSQPVPTSASTGNEGSGANAEDPRGAFKSPADALGA
jgi:hypothetical protein